MPSVLQHLVFTCVLHIFPHCLNLSAQKVHLAICWQEPACDTAICLLLSSAWPLHQGGVAFTDSVWNSVSVFYLFDYLEMTGKLFWKAVFIFLLEEGSAIKEAMVESSLHTHLKAGIQATVLKCWGMLRKWSSSCGLKDNRRLGTFFQKANKEL